MRAIVSVILLLCCLADVASAQQYVYRDGYYWSSGKAYNLVQYYDAALRCYTPRYVLVDTQPKAAYTAPASASGWRDTFAKILLEAKRYEAANKKSATEHNEYLETLEALGANGALATAPYSPRYATGGSYAAQFQGLFSSGYAPLAAQGSTVTGYGGAPAYSFSSASASYPGVPLAQLYQQAASLTQQAQDLGGAAGANFMSTVQAEGANQSRVAEILARAQAASAVIQAAGAGVPTPSATSQTSLTIGPNAGQPNAAPAPSNAASFDRYKSVATAKCVACHDGSDAPKKGPVLDFAGFADGFSRDDQLLWINLITSADPAKRMPKGGSLSGEEIAAFTALLKSE